jgi:hypothetical protein
MRGLTSPSTQILNRKENSMMMKHTEAGAAIAPAFVIPGIACVFHGIVSADSRRS